MAVNITAKVIGLLKQAGIDYSKMAGKVDPNKISQLITKTQKTATKPKLIDALNKDKATYQQALDIFENDAKYISQMNEMELVNFANNLDDYFKVGGKIKYRPSNVVTQEGAPVIGQKLETLAARKGAKEKTEATSLKGAVEGLMSLVDEMKGISPKMRNQMDRDELVAFIRKMRGRDFTNQEIRLVRDYMDEWGIGLAKEKAAPAMQYAKKLGAKNKEEFKFIEEHLDNIQTTSPEKFREMYGNVKNVNMKLSEIFDTKLEKHFKKKYKWDKTKTDGGLDDATFDKYEDELYEAQKEFSDFHRIYDTDVQPGAFGFRKSTDWVNHPKNYLDDASEKLQSITGEGLNVDFYKNYTDDVLTKYPKPESFQYGGLAGLLGERDGYYRGSMAKSRPKKKFRMPPPSWMMEPPGYRKVYESLEDIPEEALALMKKDPNFDLQTFLETVKWSEPEETRFKKIKKHGKYSDEDIPWGTASQWGQYLNYLPFGEKESIGDGLLGLKNPSDIDKVSTVMHEMRHSKMDEPWFAKSSAVPKWVQEYEGKHYLDKDIKDKYSQYRDTQQDVSGEELYMRFLDQHFYPDAAKKGDLAGSDYEPYFDKILKDHWAPNVKAYKDILKEEKRVKSKPYGLAGGGLAPLLGEPTYADGGRTGFKKGFSAGRRKFLQGVGALAALPIIGKFFKFAKPLAKTAKVADLTSVPIGNAAGMPAWFKPLVNKVIKEGDDVTKQFSTKEREIVHQVSLEGKIGKDAIGMDDIRVTQSLDDGTIRVQYNTVDSPGEYGVDLIYKKGEEIPLKGKKGSVKTKDEFTAAEAEPRYTGGPEDADIEWDGENLVDNVDDLLTDTTKLEAYATGKKPNIKKLLKSEQKQKKTQQLNESNAEQANYIEEKYGPGPDPSDFVDDFASGGRVPLAGGKGVLKGLAKLMDEFFPGTTKLGKTSKPMAEKTQLRKAIADFQEREKAAKNKKLINENKTVFGLKDYDTSGMSDVKQRIIQLEEKLGRLNASAPGFRERAKPLIDEIEALQKIQVSRKKSPWYTDSKTLTPEEELRREFPGITDDLIKDILADTNPQRIAEVKATMHEAMKMQEKGMGVEEIINIFKKKPTKHASGGRVSLSNGGVAGMLGE